MNLVVAQEDHFQKLSTQQRLEHRAKIGVRVRAFLDNFYTEAREDFVMAVDAELWMNHLERFSQTEIMAAFQKYFDHGPRSDKGRLLKPDPGAIKTMVLKARPRPEIVETSIEPKKTRITADRAAEIMAEVGFKPKCMWG